MNGRPVTINEIKKIIELRKTGHSLPEIMKATNRGSSTVFHYAKNVHVLPMYANILKIKRGGSKNKAEKAWHTANVTASQIFDNSFNRVNRLILLAGLYWGEGSKRELSLINSDPTLIKTFVLCLQDLGIRTSELKVSLRLHEELNVKDSIKYWSHLLNVNPRLISSIEVIEGKEKGKLKYGMCRIRVAKSATYFKLLMSLIGNIRNQFNAAVVQRIEQGTPKP